ncbi:MAG TPA: 4-alpha-glucanotransferase, partial [Rhizobacter sp.]
MDELRQAVTRLCAQYGVLTEYHDVWGHRHEASTGALVTLLAELGVDASSVEAVQAAEREAKAAREREGLPPLVAIAAGNGDWTVPVQLRTPVRSLHWSITEENGVVHQGDLPLGDTGVAQVPLRPALALPPGYHRLRLEGWPGETLLVAAPAHCYEAPALREGRTWGPSVQLYALRSDRNWGIGDFGDLATVIEQWSARGAGLVGVNPLHAMFGHNPLHASPYSP